VVEGRSGRALSSRQLALCLLGDIPYGRIRLICSAERPHHVVGALEVGPEQFETVTPLVFRDD